MCLACPDAPGPFKEGHGFDKRAPIEVCIGEEVEVNRSAMSESESNRGSAIENKPESCRWCEL